LFKNLAFNFPYIVFTILSFYGLVFGSNNGRTTLSINTTRNQTLITIDPQTHLDYGLAYPLTYELDIPSNSDNLRAYRKFISEESWYLIEEKTSNDFFNGIEVVRFDYEENIAYVSIGFSEISDSIMIKITDSNNNVIPSNYSSISKYYDNRDAVVTSTADDWGAYSDSFFVETCEIFRSFNLWISCGIITDFADTNTWESIQDQLDAGNVEVVSHSRTHPHEPYENVESEVLGSKNDLIENLEMPIYNRNGSHEYIYVWMAPYGDYNESIDSMVSIGKYLIPRLFYEGEHSFSNWNNDLELYNPIGASIELGGYYSWIGSYSAFELNMVFTDVLHHGGIYHLISHPAILDWENDNFHWIHLEHISNRKNIWYVGFGHLYSYHFLQSTYPLLNVNDNDKETIFQKHIYVAQNYPNPFNPTTYIEYELQEEKFVNVIVHDILGNIVNILFNGFQTSGYKSLKWNSTNSVGQKVPAGVYFYTISAGDFKQTKKMILIK